MTPTEVTISDRLSALLDTLDELIVEGRHLVDDLEAQKGPDDESG